MFNLEIGKTYEVWVYQSHISTDELIGFYLDEVVFDSFSININDLDAVREVL